MTNEDGPACVCWNCGKAIPAWWVAGRPRPLFDAAADDDAYERWRETACAGCGRTPAEGERGEKR